jgi:hypothetical protein
MLESRLCFQPSFQPTEQLMQTAKLSCFTKDQQFMGSIREKRMGQAEGDNLYFNSNPGLKSGSSPNKNLQAAMFYSFVPNVE